MFFWYLSFLFLFSSLYLTTQFNTSGNYVVTVMILLSIPVMVLASSKRERAVRFRKPALLLMYGYLFVSSLAALVHADLNLLLTPAVLFILFLAATAVIPAYQGAQMNKVVSRAIFASHLPVILIPLALKGLETSPYRGIFYNPNSFGTVMATLFATLFALFLFHLEDYMLGRNRAAGKLLLELLGLFFLLYFIILSGSRTSVLAAAAVLLSGLGFLFIKLLRARNLSPVMIKGTLFAFISFVGVAFLVRATPFYQYLYTNIVHKFIRKAERGDVLDRRGMIWSQTIDDAGILGNGSTYFADHFGLGAHNTFLSILGEHGWIALVCFIGFLAFSGGAALKYAANQMEDKYKYLPLMLVVCFTLLSMGESMLFKVSMLAMFFSLGAAFQFTFRKKPQP